MSTYISLDSSSFIEASCENNFRISASRNDMFEDQLCKVIEIKMLCFVLIKRDIKRNFIELLHKMQFQRYFMNSIFHKLYVKDKFYVYIVLQDYFLS